MTRPGPTPRASCTPTHPRRPSVPTHSLSRSPGSAWFPPNLACPIPRIPLQNESFRKGGTKTGLPGSAVSGALLFPQLRGPSPAPSQRARPSQVCCREVRSTVRERGRRGRDVGWAVTHTSPTSARRVGPTRGAAWDVSEEVRLCARTLPALNWLDPRAPGSRTPSALRSPRGCHRAPFVKVWVSAGPRSAGVATSGKSK